MENASFEEKPNPDDTQPSPVNPEARHPAGLRKDAAGDEGQVSLPGDSPDLSQTRPMAGSSPDLPVGVYPAPEPENPPSPVPGEAVLQKPVNSTPAPSPLLPGSAASFPPSPQPPKARRGGSRWPLFTVLGLAGLILVGSISAYRGYSAGIGLRTQAEATQKAGQIDEQFQLGLQDMANHQYARARQRFEYVIQLNPSYPGVTDRYTEVLLELNTTATPTVVPTPTVTPTPDLRGVEALFTQAQQDMQNGKWTETIDGLLNLRKQDPNYQAVQVDDMLYLALRNRGIDKIGKLADLEGGTYDLALAQRFGPLDSEAQGYLNWTRLYITGASFWEIDWKQAVDYFSQVAPALPGLRDGSGLTSMERYRLALIGYGDTLMRGEDPCGARDQYQKSLDIASDPKAEAALGDAAAACDGKGEGENSGEGDQSQGGDTTVEPVDVTPTSEVSPEVPPEVATPYP